MNPPESSPPLRWKWLPRLFLWYFLTSSETSNVVASVPVLLPWVLVAVVWQDWPLHLLQQVTDRVDTGEGQLKALYLGLDGS